MKRAVGILLIVLSSSLLTAGYHVGIGGSVGVFVPGDADFRDIYSGGTDAVFGLKLGARVWQGFSCWVAGYYYQKNSETSFTEEITRIKLYPVTLSLRYMLPLRKVRPYVEVGYAYMRFEEKAAIGEVSDNGSGYMAEVGLDFLLSSRFSLESSVRYLDVRVSDDTAGYDLQLGGLQATLSFIVKL